MKDKSSDNSFWESPNHNLVETFIYGVKFHHRILERQLLGTGVYRSQHQFLMFIARNPNASQKELGECFHISRATVAVTLKKLKNGGYIERLTDETDNRFNKLHITEKGLAVVEESMRIFQSTEMRMFEGFNEAEREQLLKYLDRVKKNLERQLDEMKERDIYETLR